MDPISNPRRLGLNGQVSVVAERLVGRLAAAAEGGAGKSFDRPILIPNLYLAGHQQGAVANSRDRSGRVGILLRAAVKAPVLQRAAWAPLDDVGDLVCARRIGQDPGSPVELEDLALTTQALGNVDADVEVEGDLDVLPVIELPHWLNIVAWADARGPRARRSWGITTTASGAPPPTTTGISSRCGRWKAP